MYLLCVQICTHICRQACHSANVEVRESQFSATVPSQGLDAGQQAWQQLPAEHLTGLVKLQLLFNSYSLSSFLTLDAMSSPLNW